MKKSSFNILQAWHGWLPDRSRILLRCEGHPGLYKFLGHSNLQCIDGDWDYEIPRCVPTTSITEYQGKLNNTGATILR